MKSIGVFLLAIILSAVLVPLGFVWSIIEAFYKKGFKAGFSRFSEFLWDCALSIDQTVNVLCRELFNDVFIKENGYKFGNPDETISGVLGKNKLKGTLSKFGKILEWILDKIDKNHTINSIEE